MYYNVNKYFFKNQYSIHYNWYSRNKGNNNRVVCRVFSFETQSLYVVQAGLEFIKPQILHPESWVHMTKLQITLRLLPPSFQAGFWKRKLQKSHYSCCTRQLPPRWSNCYRSGWVFRAEWIAVLTPRKMFLEESNPAAKMRAVYGSLLSHTILQANLEMVLCVIWASSFWPPETVSVTTKSIGLSVDLPTWINQHSHDSHEKHQALHCIHRTGSLEPCQLCALPSYPREKLQYTTIRFFQKPTSFYHGTNT